MDFLLRVLVVAVVVMGLPAKGCQAGGAVSLRISQDQNSPAVTCISTTVGPTSPRIFVTQPAWRFPNGTGPLKSS